MGSLGGHLLPGSFFIMFGIWWGFITAIRFTQMKMKHPFKKGKRIGYRGSTTMPCIIMPCAGARRAPVESIMKIVLAFIALVLEAYTGFNFYEQKIPIVSENQTTILTTASATTTTSGAQMAHEHQHSHEHGHQHSHGDHASNANNNILDGNYRVIKTWEFAHGNGQHITMYSAFIIGGIIELLVHYGDDLPENIEFAVGALSFFIQGFLFNSHLHGKGVIEVYVHVLLVWAIAACFIFACLEYSNPHNVLFTYARTMFTIVQGTWFYQVGFMLYPPSDFFWKWDLDDHGQIMSIAVAFCWHILLAFTGLLVQLWCVRAYVIRTNCFKCDELIYIDNFIDDYKFGSEAANGKLDSSETRFLALNSDDDDDDDTNEKIIFNK